MQTDSYLGKVYTNPPCWDLVVDVYVNELGFYAGDHGIKQTNPRSIAEAFRLALHKSELNFYQVQSPEDYDVVLLGRTSKLGVHHCGVYYNGKVLHAITSGNLHEELSTLSDKYKIIEYWRYKGQHG